MKLRVFIFLFSSIFLLPFEKSFAQGDDLFVAEVSRRAHSLGWGLELSASFQSIESELGAVKEDLNAINANLYVSRLLGLFEPFLNFAVNFTEIGTTIKYTDIAFGTGLVFNFSSVQKSDIVPFLRLGLAYGISKEEQPSELLNINGFTSSAGLGLKIFFSTAKKVGLSVEAAYSMSFAESVERNNLSSNEAFSAKGLSSRLGLIVYL